MVVSQAALALLPIGSLAATLRADMVDYVAGVPDIVDIHNAVVGLVFLLGMRVAALIVYRERAVQVLEV
jgi:hypothetical protein